MAMVIARSTWVSWVVAGALSACAFPEAPTVVTPLESQALVGIEWTAIAINGVVPVVNPKPKLRWRSADQIVGTGGCNGFVGKAVVGDDSLRIGPLAATGKACMTAPTGQEDLFFKALEETRKAQWEDGGLVLLDAAGKPLVRLTKAP